MAGLVPAIHVFLAAAAIRRRTEATPSFGRLCPGMTTFRKTADLSTFSPLRVQRPNQLLTVFFKVFDCIAGKCEFVGRRIRPTILPAHRGVPTFRLAAEVVAVIFNVRERKSSLGAKKLKTIPGLVEFARNHEANIGQIPCSR
jgi:hypothetical protein